MLGIITPAYYVMVIPTTSSTGKEKNVPYNTNCVCVCCVSGVSVLCECVVYVCVLLQLHYSGAPLVQILADWV